MKSNAGRSRRSICAAVALALLMVVALAQGAWAGLFDCEDSPFEINPHPSLLRTKFHLIQLFGSYTVHNTIFFRDDYRGSVFWSELRLSFPRLSTMAGSRVPLPGPLVFGVLKGLHVIHRGERVD